MKVIALIAQAVNNSPVVWIFLVVSVLSSIFLGVVIWYLLGFYRLWMRSFTSGAGVKFADLLGMKVRKTDAKLIVDCRVMSVQAKAPISTKDLEVAYLSGADVELVTRAFIESKKVGQGNTFEELVDASRSEKLDEMLASKK